VIGDEISPSMSGEANQEAAAMSANLVANVERAMNKLRSLHDGDIGVLEVIACGGRVVPALRALLFEREPSGLFQTRCRAVEALAALGAYAVLMDYLRMERVASDPVERVGDDAVINAAAQALASVREQHVFELLLRLAQRPELTGVIRALSAFGRLEAIPVLIHALEDDSSRQAAEVALKRLGRPVLSALVSSAKLQSPSSQHESESSLRRRRSALRLLCEIGISQRIWPALRSLMHDIDARVSFLSCQLCLLNARASERSHAVRRLIGLLPGSDWMLRDEIENVLITHVDIARRVIDVYVQDVADTAKDTAREGPTDRVLHRVLAHAEGR
jgi:PBS lyase HEAT-like repeat